MSFPNQFDPTQAQPNSFQENGANGIQQQAQQGQQQQPMQQPMQMQQPQAPQGAEGQQPFQGQGQMEQGQIGGPAGGADSKTTLWYVHTPHSYLNDQDKEVAVRVSLASWHCRVSSLSRLDGYAVAWCILSRQFSLPRYLCTH